MAKTAVIIGSGPAGLTAAYELAQRTDIKPVVIEASDGVGGISRTFEYKGNRVDIGGHRFFTKSDRVLEWWLNLLPLERGADNPNGPDPETEDRVMLIQRRISRIYFLRKFFDYPVNFTLQTLLNLGPAKAARIVLSYLRSLLFPIRNVRNLEQLMINRFGRELYNTFFKSYTEKVWGAPCDKISSEWGVQRIKDLSIAKAALHFLRNLFVRDNSIRQESTSTSLIEYFMYPKFGPGQMWTEAARVVQEKGGEIYFNTRVNGVFTEGNRVTGVRLIDAASGTERMMDADYVFSSMPIADLIATITPTPPEEVREVAAGLQYRDFIAVGLLVKKLKIRNDAPGADKDALIQDTWIYIQEREVQMGRLQIFNNWSRYMIQDPENTVWLGVEYFCNKGDDLWVKTDDDLIRFAVDELAKIDIIEKDDALDGVVLRMSGTYPAYVGAYDRFDVIRSFVDEFENLFLVGRNGMHRYNNQDHSMLTAMTAVDNIINGVASKQNIWDVNLEQEYHEDNARC
jgi:protoporphyrinogen oxidase